MVVLEPIGRTMETGNCYVCHGTKLITDSHSCELICANCGLVISDRAEDYEGTENVSNSRYDMGLYTTMRDITRDANGHILNIITRSKMSRLKRLDTSTKNGSNLKDVFDHLDNLKHILSLSDAVVEKTAYIYRKARHRSLIRGRPRFSMLAACLYLACRELQTGRTMNDIIQVTNLKKKDLSRDYRLLLFELDLLDLPMKKYGGSQWVGKVIMHVDLDSFFPSCEELRDPTLKGKPHAVIMTDETKDNITKGAVASCSYEARKYGVRSAMSLFTAKQLCPQLILNPVDKSYYQEISGKIMNLIEEYADVLEQASIDEAYLHCTKKIANTQVDIKQYAIKIKDTIRQQYQLLSSIGVSCQDSF